MQSMGPNGFKIFIYSVDVKNKLIQIEGFRGSCMERERDRERGERSWKFGVFVWFMRCEAER